MIEGMLYQSSPGDYPQTFTFRVGHSHHGFQANDLTMAMQLAEQHNASYWTLWAKPMLGWIDGGYPRVMPLVKKRSKPTWSDLSLMTVLSCQGSTDEQIVLDCARSAVWRTTS
jgi:hypothetical protein